MSVIPDHINKFYKEDPEEILEKYLTDKFGQRYLDYRNRYKEYLIDKEHEHFYDYPMTVVLELVNRCNLECIMCYQGWRNDAKLVSLDDKMLDKMFDDFKENQLSCLMISASEPLLFKDLDKVLKRAEEANIMDIFLFTNGILLDEKKSLEILNSQITRLFISIDGATSDTYNKVRVPVSKRLKGVNRLDDLENNIKNFIKLREKQGKKLPVVRTSYVALNENKNEIKEFVNKWENIVDSVEVQREVSIDSYYKIRDLTEEEAKPKLNKYNCQEPWGQMGIYSDGTVAPCCNIVGRNSPIGNISTSSVKEIWNSKEMNLVREGFKNNSPNKTCRICIEESQSEIYKDF